MVIFLNSIRSWVRALAGSFVACLALLSPAHAAHPPCYDHIVIAVEENKDYEEIIGNKDAPFLNRLAEEGVSLTNMFAEEHPSEGNYFWLFAGSDMNVGFRDAVPARLFAAPNLGAELIQKGLSFKGYSQSLPKIGSTVHYGPTGLYARKHVAWVSFSNVPNGSTVETSSNLRFADFPSDFGELPTVAFVIPDLRHDMHDGEPNDSIPRGDTWLQRNLSAYSDWAKAHNSLLIITFDESDNSSGYRGLTDPAVAAGTDQTRRDRRNRIPTIFAGAHVKRHYADPTPLDHVSLLRTIEAIYGLPKAGTQQPNALRAGIGDDATATGVFTEAPSPDHSGGATEGLFGAAQLNSAEPHGCRR
jgi:acid phosphatase